MKYFTFISAVRSFFYINIFILALLVALLYIFFRMNYLRQLLGTTHHIWEYYFEEKNKKKSWVPKIQQHKIKEKKTHSPIWFICLVFWFCSRFSKVIKYNKELRENSNKQQKKSIKSVRWIFHIFEWGISIGYFKDRFISTFFYVAWQDNYRVLIYENYKSIGTTT